MAYVTGTANSFADLLTAIRNACTGNGWTLSGSVLHKGACFAQVLNETITGMVTPPANGYLSVRAANGIDGSNNPTDAAGNRSWIGRLHPPAGNDPPDWSWPITYHVMINSSPDEVWVFVNYNVEYWQWLAFGQGGVPGNAGTGNWHAASIAQPRYTWVRVNSSRIGPAGTSGFNMVNQAGFCPMPFWVFTASFNVEPTGAFLGPNGYIHGAIDEGSGLPAWSDPTYGLLQIGGSYFLSGTVGAGKSIEPLYGLLPSTWNSESPLLPVQILQTRPSAKVSLIGELAHSRLCRNNFIQPGEVIPIGPDRWKIFPAYRRNIAVTGDIGGGQAQLGADHSGTFAIAVRYDGP